MPPASTSPLKSIGATMVSSRRILILGLIICFIAPPFAGIVYSLGFLFHKPTWREGLIILVWAIVWAVASIFLIQYLLQHGLIPQSLLSGFASHPPVQVSQ